MAENRNQQNQIPHSHYDYLLVGAGLFNATLANLLAACGKKCLVVERRGHVAGNVYTYEECGINVHKYGAHIFHTDDKKVWDYVSRFADFNRYTNCPVVNYKDHLYNLPFNMNTFAKIWPTVITPEDAKSHIEEQSQVMAGKSPQNLEEQAISLVGRDIYKILVKGYTEKQWGRDCAELPPDIIKRLPLRFTFDNNYFSDRYQGIPVGGYTGMVERMLGDTEVLLGTDYLRHREEFDAIADKVVYTGAIDEFFGYELGSLEYRTLRFETERLDVANFQGNAVVNYTEREIPYTRIIEHKHFENQNAALLDLPVTVITREYPGEWKPGDEPYYAVNDGKNSALYKKYADKAASQSKVVFGGRLGMYRYFDMDDTIAEAFRLFERMTGESK